jgi:hypothetical protein
MEGLKRTGGILYRMEVWDGLVPPTNHPLGDPQTNTAPLIVAGGSGVKKKETCRGANMKQVKVLLLVLSFLSVTDV